MKHAYRSFNTPIESAWAVIASGVPLIFATSDDADPVPPECLRVYWQSFGDPTGQPNEREAVIDLALFVPPSGNKPNPALALDRATAIDRALALDDDGLVGGAGRGRLGRFNYTTTPITYLGDMDVIPDGGWIPIPTGSPGQLHVARTVRLIYRLSASAPFG